MSPPTQSNGDRNQEDFHSPPATAAKMGEEARREILRTNSFFEFPNSFNGLNYPKQDMEAMMRYLIGVRDRKQAQREFVDRSKALKEHFENPAFEGRIGSEPPVNDQRLVSSRMYRAQPAAVLDPLPRPRLLSQTPDIVGDPFWPQLPSYKELRETIRLATPDRPIPSVENPSMFCTPRSASPARGEQSHCPGPPYVSNTPPVKLPSKFDVGDLITLWSEGSVMDSKSRITDKHRQMIRYVDICIVRGVARGRYVRWDITHRGFWQVAGMPGNYRSLADRLPLNQAKPVFVDIRNGGPMNSFFCQLVDDSRRVTGLFIQMYGYPNEVACRCCMKRFRDSDSEQNAGMWPFFGCRSLPGVLSGSCGVCVFSINGHNCEFRQDKFSNLRAREHREPPIVEDLTIENSPVAKRWRGKDVLEWVEKRVKPLY